MNFRDQRKGQVSQYLICRSKYGLNTSQKFWSHHSKMAYFNGKIYSLDQLEQFYWDMELPKCFSFCGILESITVIDEVRQIVSNITPPPIFCCILIEYSEPNTGSSGIKNQLGG